MSSVLRSVIVPYTSAEMFELVAQLDAYPQFMPWCPSAKVLEKLDDGLIGAVTIGFSGMNQTFTTRNRHDYPHRIDVQLLDERHPQVKKTPFSMLDGTWTFTDMPGKGCRIELNLQYAFKSRTLSLVVGPVFSQIANSLVDSFVRRARQLYGHQS